MTHCPENERIICQYIENGDGVLVRDCIGCEHHDNRVRATGALPIPEELDGWKAVGCLFIGIMLFIGIFSALYFIVNAFRP